MCVVSGFDTTHTLTLCQLNISQCFFLALKPSPELNRMCMITYNECLYICLQATNCTIRLRKAAIVAPQKHFTDDRQGREKADKVKKL